MSSAPFRFKQFVVEQNKAAMKVGVDGVLLGAWASISSDGQILDVGTGTGLIALMAAQRTTDAHITAIDIEPGAVEEAHYNFTQAPFAKRLTAHCATLQAFQSEVKFDDILCNPPFFKATSLASSEQRSIARQALTLTLLDLMKDSKRLASSSGRLHIVFPYDRVNEVIASALAHNWHLSKRLDIRPKRDKDYHRVLLSFGGTACQVKHQEMFIETETRHQYSADYIALTKEFYLKM